MNTQKDMQVELSKKITESAWGINYGNEVRGIDTSEYQNEEYQENLENMLDKYEDDRYRQASDDYTGIWGV